MKSFKEYAMTSRQQIAQIQGYWGDLKAYGAQKSVDDVKKKSLERKFGIRDIKLDRKGKIISFKSERGKLVAGDEGKNEGYQEDQNLADLVGGEASDMIKALKKGDVRKAKTSYKAIGRLLK